MLCLVVFGAKKKIDFYLLFYLVRMNESFIANKTDFGKVDLRKKRMLFAFEIGRQKYKLEEQDAESSLIRCDFTNFSDVFTNSQKPTLSNEHS